MLNAFQILMFTISLFASFFSFSKDGTESLHGRFSLGIAGALFLLSFVVEKFA